MDLKKVCYFVITGASRGIGKTMAIECCRAFKAGSVAVLIARSAEGLTATKNEILKVNDKIIVKTYPKDLSECNSEDFQALMADSLVDTKKSEFEQAFIVHNAGTVGDVSKKARDFADALELSAYYRLNVASVIVLNSVFMKTFGDIPKLIVNITSKCAIVPMPGFSLYCSGKAARELYFQTLAEEELDSIVLNYSPGPVDTDMVQEVEEKAAYQNLKDYFKQQREKKTILAPSATVEKFLAVLQRLDFKSGAHVDYYD